MLLGSIWPQLRSTTRTSLGLGGPSSSSVTTVQLFHELLDGAALQEMLFDQIRHIVGGQAHVVDAFGIDHHLRPAAAAADARRFQHLHFIDQTLRHQFVLQRVFHFVRAFRQALRINTD